MVYTDKTAHYNDSRTAARLLSRAHAAVSGRKRPSTLLCAAVMMITARAL